jgi:predicted amidophosphoribosyltransferase
MQQFAGIRPAWRALSRVALTALLPPRCLSCGAGVEEPGSLCGACWGGLAFLGHPLCAACGYPFEYDVGPDALCGACARERPLYDRARVVLRYDDASRRLLLGAGAAAVDVLILARVVRPQQGQQTLATARIAPT